jgi:hypothetical protein
VTGLKDTQEWFAGAVMAGERLEEAPTRLTAGPRLDAARRLDVYRRGYVSRLVECLADDYPVLKRALGDAVFESACRAYIARFPSSAPNLNAYGRAMAALLEEQGRAAEADLARLEWAVVEVIHDPSDPPLALESLAAMPADAWPAARLVPARALRLVQTRHPVNDYFQAVRDGRDVPLPGPSPSATAVYRGGWTVWRMGLTPPMFAVLSALVGGEPLERALYHAEGEPHERVMAWFREWVQSGLFVSITT